jgi:hypothetical protein
MPSTSSFGSRWLWLICFSGMILIFLIRLAFPSPVITPDSKFFSVLADNIVINHCYSVSDPQTGDCNPYWGPKPPGYAFFIALIRRLVDTDPLRVVFAQTAIFALAAATALWASYSWHKSVAAILVSLLMLAFSPVSVAWPRWVLTETLAAAAGLWAFAALFRSLAARRMRVVVAAMAIGGATLVRWDQIWLLAPASICAFYLGGFSKGLRDTVAMGFSAAIPVLAMIMRAALVGLPLLPATISDPEFARGGVVAFWRQAALTQEATSGFLWPIWSQEYKDLTRFDYSSIGSSFNTVRFHVLMDRLSTLPRGSPLPADIDAELAELAAAAKESGISSTLNLIWQRASKMWTAKDAVFSSGWLSLPSAQIAENLCRMYRIVLALCCLMLLAFVRGAASVVLVGLLSYVVLRTISLASFTALEIRYLTPMFPAMEIVLASLVVGVIGRICGLRIYDDFVAHSVDRKGLFEFKANFC